MDDTLAGEVDKNLLNAVRDSIVQVRQGHGRGVLYRWRSLALSTSRDDK